MTDWAGWRKPPAAESDNAPSEPVVLAPIETIDAAAAYRARVGPVSRGILFLFRYFPLTVTYSFFAAFVFVGTGVRLTLVGLGIAGDVLRWRYAPDLKLADKEWVDLLCVGKTNASVMRSYDHWYCGLEKSFILLWIGYVVFIFFLEGFPSEKMSGAYLNMLAPLHDWGKDQLYIVERHSADLIDHGYAHRAGFLVHVEILMIFVCLIAFALLCLDGGSWLLKLYSGYPEKYHNSNKMGFAKIFYKESLDAHNNRLNKKSIMFLVYGLIFGIFGVLIIFFKEKICWNDCGRYSFTPQYGLFSFLIRIPMQIGLLFMFSLLIHYAVTLRPRAIRHAQLIRGGEKS